MSLALQLCYLSTILLNQVWKHLLTVHLSYPVSPSMLGSERYALLIKTVSLS